MKNVLTTLILLMASQCLYAEKLIFTNNGQEVDITGDAQIDFESGDISVTTVGEHSIVAADEPVILGFYPNDYDVAIGSNITVTWSVAFADTCTANVNSGVVSSWAGAKNANNGTWAQSGLVVSQLPAQIQLSCANANNDSVTQTIDLTEQVAGGGSDPTIDFFRVNGFTNSVIINPPGTANLTWSTTDVSSCTASANPAVTGWAGAKPANGSETVTIDFDTVLTLNCGGLVATVNVDYSLNEGCSANVFPPNLTMVQDTYETFNDGFPFGESTNTSFLVDVQTTQFVSLSGFSLPTDNVKRRMVFENAPTDHNLMSQGTISVSECPGDFTQSALCVRPVSNTSTVWFTTDATRPSTWCHMDHTKTYYINYVMSPNPLTQAPTCNSQFHTVCAMFYTEAL